MPARIHSVTVASVFAAAMLALAPPALASADARPPAQPPSPAAAGATPELPDDTVLARVNGAPITQRDVRLAMQDMADRLPRLNEESRHDYVLSYLIDLALGSHAALEARLDLSPEFARKLAYQRSKLLMDELLAHEARMAVTPETARKAYEQTLKDVKPEEEVRARHILLPTEEAARAAIARLQAGENFASLAAELSTDPGAARTGGDLGWFGRDRMAPEFADAAFRLKPGEISAPVKTQFGWHVIQVEDRRARPAASFEEVRPEIEAYLARKAQQDLVLGLRARAKIERYPPPADHAGPAADRTAPATGVAPAPAGGRR